MTEAVTFVRGNQRIRRLAQRPELAAGVARTRQQMADADREYAAGLAALRKAAALTQVELAKRLGVTQAAVSRIEQPHDLLLSTLSTYLHAVGGDARLVVSFQGGADIELDLAGFTAPAQPVADSSEPAAPHRDALSRRSPTVHGEPPEPPVQHEADVLDRASSRTDANRTHVRGDAMGKNDRHVVPNPKGGWDVEAPGASRASSHHDTQADAQARGREIVHNAGGGELVTHGRDGQIRDKDTIPPGNDPYPPKG